MSKDAADVIYQVKVTLSGVKPPVWRRLLVPSTVSLKKLHQILQIALGWTDSHLHEFEASGQTYGIPHSEYPNTTKNEARVVLNQVLVKARDSLTYEYDFGDGWEHKVVLEKILPSAPGARLPSCIGGARACPPEDCGGIGGYEEFLEAISDPFHAEHDEMLEWIGGDFDPNWFEQEEVNDELAHIRGL
jgi:hypothetical protein